MKNEIRKIETATGTKMFFTCEDGNLIARFEHTTAGQLTCTCHNWNVSKIDGERIEYLSSETSDGKRVGLQIEKNEYLSLNKWLCSTPAHKAKIARILGEPDAPTEGMTEAEIHAWFVSKEKEKEAKAKSENKHERGWCWKCHSHCFGDCEAN